MARKLINFCLAWTLVLGCWGGALAAAACLHVDCETAEAKSEGDDSHAAHSAGETHASAAPHDAHAEAHGGGAHESHAPEHSPAESAESARVAPGSRDTRCSHCVGRPEAPPSSRVERQSEPSRKSAKETPARPALHVLTPTAAHPRDITPAQHAPPGITDRHVLLGVFRI